MDSMFDDGLSEDWVSQPGSHPASSGSVSTRAGSAASQIRTNRSQSPASKIPRPKTAFEVTPRKARAPLASIQADKPNGVSRPASRHFSSRSMSSIPQGTVQQNKGKGPGAGEENRLDWKRRLLENGAGAGGQQDLFSPIGLEKAFRPPPEPQGGLKRTPKSVIAKQAASTQEVFPSSPPGMAKDYDRNLSLSFERPPRTAYKLDSERSEDASVSLPPMKASQKDNITHEADPIATTNELRARLQKLGLQDRPRPSTQSSDDGIAYNANTTSELVKVAATDDSLLAANGKFVTTRRGGLSTEGSFLRRSLSSASLSRDFPPAAPAPPTTKRPPIGDSTIARPSTPPELESDLPSPRKSGSPLKLFGKHDTFTNNFLNRRISQFEGVSPIITPSKIEARKAKSSPPPRIAEDDDEPEAEQSARPITSFGGGLLDTYGFKHRHASRLLTSSPAANDDDQENQPPLPQLSRDSQTRFRASKSFREVLRERRTNVEHVFTTSTKLVQNQDGTEDELDLRQENLNGEGKRIPSSPQRKRESKRRRTSEINVGDTMDALFEEQRSQGSGTQSIAGKKRKDARYETSTQTADPDVIATRHRLRPRASRQSSLVLNNDNLPTNQPVDASAEILAGELASFANGVAENMVQNMPKGRRKQSVTTADFFKEANMIMQHIRAQAQPYAESSNERGDDQLSDVGESLGEQFTLDDISRPSSREGGRARNQRQQPPPDARVVSHLRRFNELNDSGDIESSIDLSRKPSGAYETEHEDYQNESDPPNIRIHERVRGSDGAGEHDERDPYHTPNDPMSQKTAQSQGDSTRRSIPTTSSSSTGRPKVILPDKVQHIIHETVGKMTYDPRQQRWVKRPSSQSNSSAHDHVGSELTEDDPFQEIPDLDVDESQELKHTRGGIGTKPGVSSGLAQGATNISSRPSTQNEVRPSSSGTTEATRVSRFASSGPIVETRATSWGDQPLINDKSANQAASTSGHQQDQEQQRSEEKTPSEQSADVGATSRRNAKYKARVVTVAFSSPLVGPIEDNDKDVWEDESVLDLDESPEGSPSANVLPAASAGSMRSQRSAQRSKRRFSIGSKTFTPRPVSRIDEADEGSQSSKRTTSNKGNMQLMLSTPQPLRDMPGTLSMPPTAGRNSSVGFHLSPLPDFTVHADESMNLDVDYVARRRGLLSLQDVEDRFSLAIKDLVETITDVEPYEPYWEYIRKLDVHGRSLLTLHMLDEFCQRIEELDVSNNELGQVNGVPNSLRVMNISNNCLSGLTAWGHLQNIQYLNVSNNNIDTLRGFSGLIHLRELNAENNKLESLEGVLNLDGLIRLNVGSNNIKHLDLVDADLHRLVELDAFDNEIVSVHGLESLSSLERLDLSNNNLKSFPNDDAPPPRSLVALDLSKNSLSELDVTSMQWIRYINLDSNSLAAIEGLDQMEKLCHVSWRNQSPIGSGDAFSLQYQYGMQAQALALSGNKLGVFSMTTAFLNMQRLELASCGLDTLPEDFGLQLPNLRFLNLNRNGIKDLAPLLGMFGLEELHVADNRVSRLRRTTTIFGKMGNTLRLLDCRSNPITQGFYASEAPSSVSDALAIADSSGSRVSLNNLDSAVTALERLHILPSASQEVEAQRTQRLDGETTIRRRVYELLIYTSCRRLEHLDGMAVERSNTAERKETVKRLVELGVLKPKAEVNWERSAQKITAS